MDNEKLPANIAFSVDAGLINRLGMELVGRSETAVSELIKNGYDADATLVEVVFENTSEVGGTLTIFDNGEGMDLDNLTNGFMRLSSSDKIHNPISNKFKRQRAGKKGIGRFATQRLGERLTIITKRADMERAIKIIIDWTQYTIDTELTTITNTIEYVNSSFEFGTHLIIEKLREKWSEADMRRVYRYVSELLQPDFLSDRSKTLKVANQQDGSFVVKFFNKENQEKKEFATPDKMIFSKAIATIEAYIDKAGDGYYSVNSPKFKFSEYAIPISSGQKNETIESFKNLKNVHFKAYYFIYDREDYYDFDSQFTQQEYNRIKKIAEEASGIKLYRNGFRVLPYGEKGNDWLDINIKIGKLPSGEDKIAIPFRTQNLFGFVEIIDIEDISFKETASREGLINNLALEELKDFLLKTLKGASQHIASAKHLVEAKKNRTLNAQTAQKLITNTKNAIQTLKNKIALNEPDSKELLLDFLDQLPKDLEKTEASLKESVSENAMLRILAATGLVIGEFLHEIEQYDSMFVFLANQIKKETKEKETKENILKILNILDKYKVYTGYFRKSISENTRKNLQRLDMENVVNDFLNVIKNSKQNNIKIERKSYYRLDDFITCPMHPSEWQSILYNLYTNSKKAINRAKSDGLILIELSEEENFVIIKFSDNGDGVPDSFKERIFSPFFTTSAPIDNTKIDVNNNSGTGLGLYIIKNIIESYNGTIKLVPSNPPFSTSFQINIPK